MLDPQQAAALINIGIQQGEYPTHVCKYREFDQYTESLFRDHQLWFSVAKKFNDPFDCQIQDQGNYTKAEIINYLRQRVGMSPDAAAQMADRDDRDPQFFWSELEKVKSTVLGSKGILSLSTKPMDILMWSHYTNSHEGFVLGFEILKDIQFFSVPLHVKYNQDYPAYKYLTEPDKIVTHGLLTKSKFWEYEGEIRVIKNQQGLHTFAKACLVEIILGCRIEQANKDRIFQYLKNYDYGHTKVYQATPSASKYELEVQQISIP